ncbi:MAG: hypothetical protein WCS73_02605 [Lentisphaeria bacterium]
MLKVGLAQEIITPPIGVGLAGYFNKRPNQGMYDDLFVKTTILDNGKTRFGFMTFDLCFLHQPSFDCLKKRIVAEFSQELYDHLIISATHTHTGPNYSNYDAMDALTKKAHDDMIDSAILSLHRAIGNLLPSTLEATSIYNNPYGFVRRYWMKNGTIVTNPGWCNKDIDKPESDFDRTIGILAVKQKGRIAALLCNIVNHGDTIGGDIVSADWFGRFAQAIQYELTTSIPVVVLTDASGDVNHFDFHQKVNQSSYAEATRIGRGYATLVAQALKDLKPVPEEEVTINNCTVTIPHRVLTDEEFAEAKHIMATVPDIKKDGDFESQDLANKVPAALRYFAQRAIDCHDKSTPSHEGRLTAIKIGKELAFATLPGEPFNGIGRALREASPCKQTFVVELAQSESGYIPMPECFERGGYEVQAGINSSAQNAANVLIKASIENLKK